MPVRKSNGQRRLAAVIRLARIEADQAAIREKLRDIRARLEVNALRLARIAEALRLAAASEASRVG